MSKNLGFCFLLAIGAALHGQDPGQATKPDLRQVALQVLSSHEGEASSVNAASIEGEARAWLSGMDIKVVERATADPAVTYLVLLDVVTSRTPDGLQWLGVRQTWTLLGHLADKGKPAGSPQRTWSTLKVAGQKGDEAFKTTVWRTLHKSLGELTGDRAERLAVERRGIGISVHDFRNEGRQDNTFDFTFEEMKVRRQPPAPTYPQAAKDQGVQGTVVVEMTVDPKGSPVMAVALAGPEALLMTAVRYALAWEFEPAMVNGQARTARFKLTMPFKLTSR